MSPVVCDTSALQYLHQLGLLEVLKSLYGTIGVPTAVAEELDAGRALGLSLPDPLEIGWIDLCSPTDIDPRTRELGSGEAAVISALLENPQATGILDDRQARAVARSLGLTITGTLGVLVEARRRHIVLELAPLLAELRSLGFRLSPAVEAQALLLASENPAAH